jgi:hypothetical protein
VMRALSCASPTRGCARGRNERLLWPEGPPNGSEGAERDFTPVHHFERLILPRLLPAAGGSASLRVP